jgi:Mg2+/Co2+ transporter CorB
MTLGLGLTILAILVLLVISAFFSGSETGLTAVSRARMHTLEQDGDARAKIVNRLLTMRERFIGAILLGNNLVNILASALATTVFLALFGDAGVIYATIVMTAIVLVFGEVLPKTFAISNPERTALMVAPVIRIVVIVFAPVTAAVQYAVRHILRLFGPRVDDDADVLSAHEELRGAIDLHHKEGGVKKLDRDMLGGVLELSDLTVYDVMVHRTNMYAIDADLPAAEIVDAMLRSPFTRVPLWRKHPDEIIGVLHAKNLLRALNEVRGDASRLDIEALLIPNWFVPDSRPLKAQLAAFLKRKAHFAMVVDEYGAVLGIVTLEDIIEEIIGDISDEHDVAASGVRPHADGSVTVDGSVPVRDLNRMMDWDLPDEEATTIAGLVIHEARNIPDSGQSFTFHRFRFEVLKRERNALTSLKVKPLA